MLRGWKLWLFLVISPFLLVDGLDAAVGGGYVRTGPNRWVHEMFGDTSPPTPRGISARYGRGRFQFSKGLPTHLVGVTELLVALGIWAAGLFAWRATRMWEIAATVLIAAALCAFFPAVVASFAM